MVGDDLLVTRLRAAFDAEIRDLRPSADPVAAIRARLRARRRTTAAAGGAGLLVAMAVVGVAVTLPGPSHTRQAASALASPPRATRSTPTSGAGAPAGPAPTTSASVMVLAGYTVPVPAVPKVSGAAECVPAPIAVSPGGLSSVAIEQLDPTTGCTYSSTIVGATAPPSSTRKVTTAGQPDVYLTGVAHGSHSASVSLPPSAAANGFKTTAWMTVEVSAGVSDSELVTLIRTMRAGVLTHG